MAVLKGIAENTQGKSLEAYLLLPEEKKGQERLSKDVRIKLPEVVRAREELRNYKEVVSHQERARQENLGVLGRLKERTLQQALILTCNTAETIALVGLSITSLVFLGALTDKGKNYQVAGIKWITEKFDKICPKGSILSGEKPLLDSDNFRGYVFGSIKLGFGIVTYPTTLILNTVLGLVTTGIEEIDRNVFKQGINYAKYLKQIEETPSGVRDSLNLFCFVGLSFLTVGKLRSPLPVLLRSKKAAELMLPSLLMGSAGAFGEQLMRVEDVEKGDFNWRVLISDAISGALSSGIFMLGMKGVRNQAYRGFADMSDGANDFVDASAEHSRIELTSESISAGAKVARFLGYGLKLGTAAYDLGDSKVIRKVESDTGKFEVRELLAKLSQSEIVSDQKTFTKLFSLALEKSLRCFNLSEEEVILREIENLHLVFKRHPGLQVELRAAIRNIPHLESLLIGMSKREIYNAEIHYIVGDLIGNPLKDLNEKNLNYITKVREELLGACLFFLKKRELDTVKSIFELLDAYTNCYGSHADNLSQMQFINTAAYLLQYNQNKEAELLITKIWGPKTGKNPWVIIANLKDRGQTGIESIFSRTFCTYCDILLTEDTRKRASPGADSFETIDQLRELRREFIVKGVQLRIPELHKVLNGIRPGIGPWSSACAVTIEEDITYAISDFSSKANVSWQEIEEFVQNTYYSFATTKQHIKAQQAQMEKLLWDRRLSFCFLFNGKIGNIFSTRQVLSEIDGNTNDTQEFPLARRLQSHQENLRSYILEALNITNFNLDSEYDKQGNLLTSHSHPLSSLIITMREGLESCPRGEEQQVMKFYQELFQSLLPQYRRKAIVTLSQALIRDALTEKDLNFFLNLINDKGIIEEAFEIAMLYCIKPNDYFNLPIKFINYQGHSSLNVMYYLKLAKKFRAKLLEINKDYAPSVEFNKETYQLVLEHFFGRNEATKDLDPELRSAYLNDFMLNGSLTAEEKQKIVTELFPESSATKLKDSLTFQIDNYLFETISRLLETQTDQLNLAEKFKDLLTKLVLDLCLPKVYIQKSLNRLFYMLLTADLRNNNNLYTTKSMIQAVQKIFHEVTDFIVYPAIRDKAIESFLSEKLEDGIEILECVDLNDLTLDSILEEFTKRIQIGPLGQYKTKKEAIEAIVYLAHHYELKSGRLGELLLYIQSKLI